MDPVTLALAKSWAEGQFGDLRQLQQHIAALQAVSGLAPVAGELQAVSELAPYVQAILDGRIVDHNLDVPNPPNGFYIQYENGFQVFWHEEHIPQSSSGWHVHEGTYDWHLPVSVTGIWVCYAVAANPDANPASDNSVFNNDKTVARRHSSYFRIIYRATVFGSNDVRLSMYGIGRWK